MVRTFFFVSSMAILGLLPAPATAANSVATLDIGPSTVVWNPQISAESFLLEVSGPGVRLEREFLSRPSLDNIGPEGDVLRDGIGTGSPDTTLHIVGVVKIDETDDGKAPVEMLEIESDSDNDARIRFDDGTQWSAGAGSGNTFVILETVDAQAARLTALETRVTQLVD